MEKLIEVWESFFCFDRVDSDWWFRKRSSTEKRDASIVRIKGEGHVFRKLCYDKQVIFQYLLHVSFLIKKKHHFYIEEQVIPYEFRQVHGEIIDHRVIKEQSRLKKEKQVLPINEGERSRERFTYDRLAAVKYAERWWNSYNLEYKAFSVDCTNYVSQCLFAGGAPMHGAPNRNKGWWYQGDNWSFSWAVAHSLRWYLSGSTYGLKGKEVSSAKDLYPGDIICYDFEGDNKWDHNTIVVAKDADGMPLVNAHTNNSRHRYWTYEDSAAWTPNIQYKFFQIGK